MSYLLEIRNQIKAIQHPLDMAKVNGEIEGNGFFPGASGTSDGFQKKEKPILILGQDQDREEGFEKSKGKKGEEYTPTWKHLQMVLEEGGITLEDCFFTNCLLGVRKSASINTGKSPGFADPRFVAECAELLRSEIEFFQPKIILCLGLIPFRFLGLLSGEVLRRSVCIDEFKELDEWEFQLTQEESLLNHPVQIVVLCHPSYRNLNAKHRKYKEFRGEEAEKQLLVDAIHHSRLYR
ncbi:MAG: hypothetical protein OHK0019_12190 [Saprospiraceae bacterium]